MVGPHFQIYGLPGGHAFGWRLLGGNNRDLGRGADHHPDAHSCRTAIEQMVRQLDELNGILRPGRENRWVWSLRDGSTPVALSSHQYDRQVRCEQARQQFLTYARLATIGDTLLLSTPRRGGVVAAIVGRG